ncbi:hypothetical protein KEJ36_03480 [Candidatus Bathyarchaeota archaeon]|nr:hypothetical protein [Candidatus Bathyarchaeota archaeon]
MVKFEPILRKPGELIRSEDWNKMQEAIRADLQELERKLQILKDYVDNMEETVTLLNVTSPVGKSYNLNEIIPGETTSYEAPIVGFITKQWLLERGGVGTICTFGLVTLLQSLDYWAGAENGDKKALEAVLEYMDGTSAVLGGLFVHDRTRLRPKGAENPYIEYLLSPNEHVWYRYRLTNPNPEREVLSVSFRNRDASCTPRIGNVIHYRARLIPAKLLQG